MATPRDNTPTGFFSVPRTVTALIIGVVALFWYSGAGHPDQATGPNHKAGIMAVAATFLAFSALQGPNSVMVRPHPVVWRLVHGLAILYLLGLVFLLFQGKDEARALLKHFDSNLGKELPERAYGQDCRLWIPGEGLHTKVLYETLWDEFVIAHSLGWIGKAIVLRNHWILWTCSIGFELMEQTFQHWLANFNECWWDSWLLDVAICNWGGLVVGMMAVKYFGSKNYNWQGTQRKTGIIRRGLQQFTPATFEIFDWAIFSTPKRCLQALTLVAMTLAFELNAFFLKTLLWLPPPHFLNISRLLFLWLLALPAVKEYHSFLEGQSQDVFNKLGTFAWLAAAILGAELLNVAKLSRGEFTAPFPDHIKMALAVVGALFAAFLAGWQVKLWVGNYVTKASPPGAMKKGKRGKVQ